MSSDSRYEGRAAWRGRRAHRGRLELTSGSQRRWRVLVGVASCSSPGALGAGCAAAGCAHCAQRVLRRRFTLSSLSYPWSSGQWCGWKSPEINDSTLATCALLAVAVSHLALSCCLSPRGRESCLCPECPRCLHCPPANHSGSFSVTRWPIWALKCGCSSHLDATARGCVGCLIKHARVAMPGT